MQPTETRELRAVSRTWLYVILGATAAFHAVFLARTAFSVDGALHFSLFDDAMISMRYARNLAEGHGLVWNPGEDAVEGITNPLWTVWMAALHVVPVSDAIVSLLVGISSSLLLLGNVVVVWAIARRIAPQSRIAAPIAAVLTAQSFALTFWALRGMEVALLAILVNSAFLASLRIRDGDGEHNVALLGLALGAAVLTRQDALLPAAIIAVYAVVAAPASLKRRLAITAAGALVGTTAVLTVFRLAYYGDALPNTYYLKTTGVALSTRIDRGWVALRQLVAHQLAPFLALGALAFTGAGRRRLDRYALSALVIAQTLYSVFVGGDAWENEPFANRYLAVVLPALFLLVAMGVESIVRATRRGAALRLAAVTAVVGGAFLWLAWLRSNHKVLFSGMEYARHLAAPAGVTFLVAAAALLVFAFFARAEQQPAAPHSRGALAVVVVGVCVVAAGYIPMRLWVEHDASLARADALVAAIGVVEARTTGPDARIAVWWAGNGPYFSHRESIDVYGKSDRHVARRDPSLPFRPGHNKRDLRYSIERLRPDVIDVGVRLSANDEDARAFARWGYEQVVEGVFVRRDSNLVDRDALAEGVEKVRAELEE